MSERKPHANYFFTQEIILWTSSVVTEPKDNEVWEIILRHYYELKFSPAIKAELKQSADNPKRRQHNVKKQLQNAGIGTKSQQALQMQREENKLERKSVSREQREAEKQLILCVSALVDH